MSRFGGGVSPVQGPFRRRRQTTGSAVDDALLALIDSARPQEPAVAPAPPVQPRRPIRSSAAAAAGSLSPFAALAPTLSPDGASELPPLPIGGTGRRFVGSAPNQSAVAEATRIVDRQDAARAASDRVAGRRAGIRAGLEAPLGGPGALASTRQSPQIIDEILQGQRPLSDATFSGDPHVRAFFGEQGTFRQRQAQARAAFAAANPQDVRNVRNDPELAARVAAAQAELDANRLTPSQIRTRRAAAQRRADIVAGRIGPEDLRDADEQRLALTSGERRNRRAAARAQRLAEVQQDRAERRERTSRRARAEALGVSPAELFQIETALGAQQSEQEAELEAERIRAAGRGPTALDEARRRQAEAEAAGQEIENEAARRGLGLDGEGAEAGAVAEAGGAETVPQGPTAAQLAEAQRVLDERRGEGATDEVPEVAGAGVERAARERARAAAGATRQTGVSITPEDTAVLAGRNAALLAASAAAAPTSRAQVAGGGRGPGDTADFTRGRAAVADAAAAGEVAQREFSVAAGKVASAMRAFAEDPEALQAQAALALNALQGNRQTGPTIDALRLALERILAGDVDPDQVRAIADDIAALAGRELKAAVRRSRRARNR